MNIADIKIGNVFEVLEPGYRNLYGRSIKIIKADIKYQEISFQYIDSNDICFGTIFRRTYDNFISCGYYDIALKEMDISPLFEDFDL